MATTARRFRKFNVFKYAMLGLFGGLISFVVSRILKFFPDLPTFYKGNEFISITASTVDIDLRQQAIQAGQFEEFGINLIQFLQNNLGFNTEAFFGVMVTSVLVLIAGRWIIGYSKPGKLLMKWQVFLSYLLGSALFSVLAVLVLGLSFGIIPSIITYGGIIGLIVQIMVSWDKATWITEN